MDQAIDIFIEQLLNDEELRDSFFRHPRQTLRMAGDWGLPLSDSEVAALLAVEPSLWNRIAAQLIDQLQPAA